MSSLWNGCCRGWNDEMSDSPNLWNYCKEGEGWDMTSWGCTGQLFVCGWAVLVVSTTWHVQYHQKSRARIATKSSLSKWYISWGHFFLSSCMKPEFKNEKNYREIFATLRHCVLHSWFSNRLSRARSWPRPFNWTPFWRSWFWWLTTLEMKGPRLGVRWGWDHEGRRAVKKYRKEGSRHSRMKETSGKWRKAMQCSVDFQMHSSSWNLWWQVIGVF